MANDENDGSELFRQNFRWPMTAAACWMLLVVGCYFVLELPNNRPYHRYELWPLVMGLIDYIDPLAPSADDAALAQAYSGWRYFPQRFDLLAIAGVMFAGAYCLGSLAQRGLRVSPSLTALERFVFACGLGFSLLSLLTLAAGLVGWLSRPLLGGTIGLALLAEVAQGVFSLLKTRRRTQRRPARGDETESSVPGATSPSARGGKLTAVLSLAVVTPFLLIMLLGALLPSTDFDVNEYHFLGPKEFFQTGQISFLPHNVYTSFPFGTEMLTLLAMVLRGDWYRGALAGKCVLMGFGPLTALALYAAGRRWFGHGAGLFAAVLYLTTPWIYRISTIAYAEGGLCFYLFASLFATLVALEANGRERPGAAPDGNDPASTGGYPPAPAMALPLLAGLLAGSAMACKYPGAVSVVIPLFAIAAYASGRSQGAAPARNRLCLPLAFAAGVLVTVGPWLVKNTVETGNPVYPLMYTVFGGRDWDAALNEKWRAGHRPDSLWPASLVNLVWDIVVRNDWVNPLLFAFAPLAWLDRRARPIARRLWLYVGYLIVTVWLLTHRIDRFWVPLTPVAALLGGGGAAWCFSSVWLGTPVTILRFIAGLCLVAVIPFNLAFNLSPLGGYNAYLLDLDLASTYVASLTAPEVFYLNVHLPAGSRVLSVGDAELFEARFGVVYNTVFDHSIFEEWCAGEPGADPAVERPLRDAAEIRAKFAAQGITHVYVNWLEILRYRAPGSYGYTDFVTPRRFAELQRLGVLGAAWHIPSAVTQVDRLDSAWQAELRRFAPELISGRGATQTVSTFQVFPVVGRAE
ncbi:MAG: hypothetical protein EXS05_17315 [Planctomycetaceae bacterium]|nr:hypothetical protein [Planctomycetaceae bacterium]